MTQISGVYTFENESMIYEIDADSQYGREYQNLANGPDKIKHLKLNGKATTKTPRDRIMVPQKGAWRFYNVGQLEYMFRSDNDLDGQSSLEKEIMEIRDPDEKKAFFMQNVTRIREWPERIQRVQNLA